MSDSILPSVVREQQQVEAPTSNLVLPVRFVGTLKVGSTIPSVKNVERWKAANTGALSVVDFKDGQNGQEIRILGDGFTTVNNNVHIKTNTGANKLLAANKAYTFTLYDGVWIENA